jgi:phage terminase small subunit
MATQGLTPKQRHFAREYLVDLNATQAAIRAGYSPNWADRTAHRLVEKSRVKRYIRELQEERAARVELTADKVVRELALLAFSNVADYQVTDLGNLKVRQSADRGAIRAVSSFKRKVKTVLGEKGAPGSLAEVESEVKLWDKIGALKMLAQHLGIVDKPERLPLEQFLALFPEHLADGLRKLLADGLAARGNNPGG